MDPFQKLAERLDQIPNGFPKTGSGVELKLLAKLFTPEEVKALRHFVEEELERELIVEFDIDLSQPLDKQDCMGPINDSDGEDIIYLNTLESYNLPFEVRGIYYSEQGMPVIKDWEAYKFRKPTKKQ